MRIYLCTLKHLRFPFRGNNGGVFILANFIIYFANSFLTLLTKLKGRIYLDFKIGKSTNQSYELAKIH